MTKYVYTIFAINFSLILRKAAIMLLKKLRLDRELCIVDIGSI